MISAKEARKQTDANKVDSIRKHIEELIKKAISKGRDSITTTGQIPACIVSELEENGFVVSNNMIKW